MKTVFGPLLLLLLVALCSSYKAPTCRCRALCFEDEVAAADQIFTGRVVERKAVDFVTYTFLITRGFKGVSSDTLTVQTGHGGGDCGALFKLGELYVIYARDGRTNACRRNALLHKTKDDEALAKLFSERERKR
jgi:hypothetical protein